MKKKNRCKVLREHKAILIQTEVAYLILFFSFITFKYFSFIVIVVSCPSMDTDF